MICLILMVKSKKIISLENKARFEAKFNQELILLTIFASLLAVLGLKMNSPYVLIGAMLVSPIFDPLISAVVFLVSKNKHSLVTATKSLFIAILLSIFTSMVFWFLLNITNQLETFQYLQISFSLFDILAVSVLMGVVGMLLWIWPKSSNTSAGVAIAISLVPPIANFSAGLVLGDLNNSMNYFIILVLNLLGIFLGALLILVIYSSGRFQNKL